MQDVPYPTQTGMGASPAAPAPRILRIDLVCGLLFGLGLLLFAASGVYINDEFTLLSDAKRILEGQVPYRDFFEFVPPLPLWVLAIALRLFGASLRTSHVLTAGVIGISGVLLVHLARKLEVGLLVAWLPAFLLLFVQYAHWDCFSHHWLAVPLALGALALAMHGLAVTGSGPWLGAGLLIGLTGLAVQSDGPLLGLALTAAVLFDAWLRPLPWQVAVGRVGRMVFGALLPVLAAFGCLALQGAFGAAWQDIVVFPLTQYRQAGGINDVGFATDLPGLLTPVTTLSRWYIRVFHVLATTVLMPLTAVGTLAWLAGWAWRRSDWGLLQARLALVGFWGLMSLAIVLRGRADYQHLSMYMTPAVLLATCAAAHLARRPVGPGALVLRFAPLCLLVMLGLSGALGFARAVLSEPAAWNQPGDPDARLRNSPVVAYVRTHARPGDHVAAMPAGGLFYFYGAPAGSRWTCMWPPLMGYNSALEFEAFWQDIARTRPRFIVVAPWAWVQLDRAVAQYTDHLPPHYHLVGHFANVQYNNLFPASLYEVDQASGTQGAR